MTRIAIDLDDELVEPAMKIYGTTTKAAAVRAAMEGRRQTALAPAVHRRRQVGRHRLERDRREDEGGPTLIARQHSRVRSPQFASELGHRALPLRMQHHQSQQLSLEPPAQDRQERRRNLHWTRHIVRRT
jgi:Arc/MetJ family transcription regulator